MSTVQATNISNDGDNIRASIGMYVAIISWSMLFATLFLGYVIFRFTSETWPPMGLRIPLVLPSASSLVILLSSVTYYFYQEFSLNKLQAAKAKLFFLLTILLGTAFIILQFALWSDLKELGIYASSGIFPSLIYSFTWIHTAHMALAFAGLVWLLPYTLKFNANGPFAKHILLINVGKFWHFLGIIWFLIYFLIFVF